MTSLKDWLLLLLVAAFALLIFPQRSAAQGAITISPASLPTVIAGSPYSRTLTASGGAGQYSFQLIAGAFPAGLSVAPGGTVSGVTTAAPGNYPIVIRATDINGVFGDRSYTVAVANPVITVTPGSLPPGVVGRSYSQALAASGAEAPYSFVFAGKTMPPGLSLQGNLISGVPTQPANYQFPVIVTDANGYSTRMEYILQISYAPISVAPASLPDGVRGQSYNQSLAASGGAAPYQFAVSSGILPPGLTLSQGGAISGVASAGGAFNFTVQVSDSAGDSRPFTYRITISQPPLALAPTALPDAVRGQPYSQTIVASGGSAPYVYRHDGMPQGLTFSSTGVLSGTVQTAGSYPIGVTATDQYGVTGHRTYTLIVQPTALTLSPTNLPTATAYEPYSQTLAAGGGTAPYVFSLVTPPPLPVGLTLSADGVISGSPKAPGTGTVKVRVTDAEGVSDDFLVRMSIVEPPVVFSPDSLPDAPFGQPYNVTVVAHGGPTTKSYAIHPNASLPPGLTLSSQGVISGAPTKAGVYSFLMNVRAPGFGAFSIYRAYTITVPAPAIAVSPGALPGGSRGTAYSQVLTASGGLAPYAFTLDSGALPPGLTLSTGGAIAGTPTAGGGFNFVVRVTDSAGTTSIAPYSLTISQPPLVLTPATLPDATLNQPYSQSITASGGSAPYVYQGAVALPPGLSMSPDGLVSGTPAVAGVHMFTVQATDRYGVTGSQQHSLTVNSSGIIVSPPTLPTVTGGLAYSQSLTASGGSAPYAFALISGALPRGITLSSGGLLSGQSTASPGTYAFTVRVTDAGGATVDILYRLRMENPTLVMAPAVLPAAVYDTPYSQTLTVSGGSAPYSMGIVRGRLPEGLSLTDNVIAGTPTETGTFSIDLHYRDAYSYISSIRYELVVSGPSIAVSPDALPSGRVGDPYNQPIIGSGGVGPYTYALHVGRFPEGMGLSTDGVVVGTPSEAGDFGLEINVTDSRGFSARKGYLLSIQPLQPAPVPAPPTTVEIMGGQTATVDLVSGATGGPFTAATITGMGPSSSGSAILLNPAPGQYSLVVTPEPDFSGTMTVSYTLSNAAATSAPGTITVVVVARPDPTIDPEVTGLIATQGETARRFVTSQVDNINGRLDQLRSGGGRGGSARIAFSGGSQDVDYGLAAGLRRDDSAGRENPDLTLSASSLVGQVAAQADALAPAALSSSGETATVGRFGIWAAGTIDFGRRDGQASMESARFTTSGLTAGLDYQVDDRLIIGVAAGYGRDETRVGENGTRSEADGYSVSAYGSFRSSAALFLDGVVGYGVLDLKSRRFIDATNDIAVGGREADQWFSSIRLGREMMREGWRLAPYGRLSMTRSVLDAFAETSGGPYALAYDEQVVQTTTGGLGIILDSGRDVRWGRLRTRALLEYAHEFQDAARAGLAYVDWLNGPRYEATLPPWADDRVRAGLGMDLLQDSGVTLGFDYQLGVGADLLQHQIRLQFEVPF